MQLGVVGSWTMNELTITSFDQVTLRVVHSEISTHRKNLVIVLPLATKASLIHSATNALCHMYNIITWESRLVLDPHILMPDPKTLSIEASIRDFYSILAHFSIDTVMLLGYCSGAATALHIAAKSGSRIQKLALINGAYFMKKSECELTQYERDIFDLAPLMASGHDHAAWLARRFMSNKWVNSRTGEFAQEVSRPYRDVESLYRFGLGLCNFLASDLGSITRKVTMPVLVAAGERDDQTHYSSSMFISSELPSSEIYIDHDGDHYEFCRAKPALIERILTFFVGHQGVYDAS